MESNHGSKKTREDGVDNNGMDNDELERQEENDEQESERCSQRSQDADQVKSSAEESDSIQQRCSEGSNPASNVHKLLSDRYAALGPLSFKEQQVQLFCNILVWSLLTNRHSLKSN